MKKKIIKYGITLFILFSFIIWIIIGNLTIGITKYTIASENLPDSFDGYKIIQISDLHNTRLVKNNDRLIDRIDEANPDIIVITGDLIDSSSTDIDIALDFIEKLSNIAEIYYVTGNHEGWVTNDIYNELEIGLREINVNILHNRGTTIEKGEDKISITGIDDPDYGIGASRLGVLGLNSLSSFEGYNILLSHRPEEFDIYANSKYDLVLTGHAHGGQVRIPFIGGLIAPNQGLFPEYDSGVFTSNNTTMVVSRGIGNSIIKLRVNNRPEIVLIELSK